MIRIGVTGAGGQLAKCLQEIDHEYEDMEVLYFTRSEWDITDRGQAHRTLKDNTFDILINTAAYTAVDKAESEYDRCMEVNATAIDGLIEACNENRCHLIHLSSDYVYHTAARHPLKESDPCQPKSVYGRSKLAGDRKIIDHAHSATIIRTSWVYSAYGHNFVKTMLRLSASHQELRVVQDQWGCPTSAHDLARTILNMIRQGKLMKKEAEILHFTNEGLTCWYEIAREIFKMTGKDVKVVPVTTESYGAAAPRPYWSILSCEKYDQRMGNGRRHWKKALEDCLARLEG